MKSVGVIVFSAALVVASPAVANDLAEAKQHFDQGSRWFDLGDFPRAITEYKAAYAAHPDPVFLYNIAQAARLNNDLSTALFFYRSYLRRVPTAYNRHEVEDRISKLESQIAQQKALVTTPPNSPAQPSSPLPGKAPEPPPSHAPAEEVPAGGAPESGTPSPAEVPRQATATTPSNTLVATAPAPEKKPLYKRWQLWTAVGVVAAAGLAVGLGVGLSSSGSAPSTHFGVSKVGF
jgi:hypothetical protein